MIYEHLIKVVGLSNWPVYYPVYHNSALKDPFFSIDQQPVYLHNTFLQLLAETGLIGLLLYSLVFIILVFTILRKTQLIADPNILLLAVCIILSIGCYLVNSIFTFP